MLCHDLRPVTFRSIQLMRFKCAPPTPPAKVVSSRVPSAPGSLQRSRSDIDVNAATSAKSRMTTVPTSAAPFSSAAALPPGSYASLGNASAPFRPPFFPHPFICSVNGVSPVLWTLSPLTFLLMRSEKREHHCLSAQVMSLINLDRLHDHH